MAHAATNATTEAAIIIRKRQKLPAIRYPPVPVSAVTRFAERWQNGAEKMEAMTLGPAFWICAALGIVHPFHSL